MAYSFPKIELVKDNVIRVYHPEPLEPKTYLTASVAAGGTALTVRSNLGFSNTNPQDLLLFEGLGNKNAEIKRINGAITAGTALTSQAVTFAHGIDSSIQKILFDQIEIRGSDTDAATAASTSGTIVQFNGNNLNPINITGLFTDFIVTGTTYSFYGARFHNSLVTTVYYSAFSDGVGSSGHDFNTVGYIRRNAFANQSEEMIGKFTAQWVYDQIFSGELDIKKELRQGRDFTVIDYDAGNLATGQIAFTLPSDIEDTNTNGSMLGLRIAKRQNLTYINQAGYQALMDGVGFTTLSSTAAVGATTMVLTDSRDFDDSGSVNIAGTSYSYTGNTRSTGTLTGFTALTAEITSGTNVFQNITFGEPTQYTIDDGSVKFDVPISSDFNGRNIWMDYYINPPRVNTDSDALTVNDPMLIQFYLEMMIRKKKANGSLPINDPMVLEYEKRKLKYLRNELSGQAVQLIPAVPDTGFNYPLTWY